MNYEILNTILSFAGGLGLFLYGIPLLAEGMENIAGAKTKNLIGMLTSNKIMGVLVGALVTALIQSSSATTVMVVGFVNAQLMNLQQATSVIMGANIGTTITAWIVSLGEWTAFLKPEYMAPIFLLIGVFVILLTNKPKLKQGANIVIGFGLLFLGLSLMSGAIEPYADSPIFRELFTVVGNSPFLALLVGIVVTAILQSSSASMGILQTLAMTGVVNWGSAVFISLGQNIGTCVTALMSSIGANRNGKRASVIHLLFNVIGAVIVGMLAWVIFMFNPTLKMLEVSSTGLAIFHTVFKIALTVLMMPFSEWLVKLAELIVPITSEKPEIEILDKRFITTPTLAMEVVKEELVAVSKVVLESLSYLPKLVTEGMYKEDILKNETIVNDKDKSITEYLDAITLETMSPEIEHDLKVSLLVMRYLEHISDHCTKLAKGVGDKQVSDEEAIKYIEQIALSCTDVVKAIFKNRNQEIDTTELDNLIKEAYDYCMQLVSKDIKQGRLVLDTLTCYTKVISDCKRIVKQPSLEYYGA